MIIPIEINQQDILSQFSLSQQEVEQVIDFAVKEVTAAFAVKWEEQARIDLSSTRDRYIQNLKVVDEGRMSGAVVLDYSKDPLIRMIEEGATAFDLKEEGFSKSDKRIAKDDGGWYLTIPFSVGTPGALTSGFTNILPTQIYNIVSKKEISPLSERSKGISRNELESPQVPKEMQQARTRAAIVIPESKAFQEYKHKTSIYQGVYKKKDAVTGQVSYGSFRRVSDKSDENSWIHPGITQMNLAERAMDRFETGMQTVLEDAMNAALAQFGLD